MISCLERPSQLFSWRNKYEVNRTSYVASKNRDTTAQQTYTLFATNLATYVQRKAVRNPLLSRKNENRLNTHRTSPANGAAVRHLTNAQTVRQKTSSATHASKQDTFETYAGHPPALPNTVIDITWDAFRIK